MCQPPPNVAAPATPAPLLNPQPGPVLNVRFLDGALNTFTPSVIPTPDNFRPNNGNVCRGDDYAPPPPYTLTPFVDGPSSFVLLGGTLGQTLGAYTVHACEMTRDGEPAVFLLFISPTAAAVPEPASGRRSIYYLDTVGAQKTAYALLA